MQSGLKNLQSAARACARRERLEPPHHGASGSGSSLLPVQHGHDSHGAYGDPHSADDSGIGLDELEAEYHSAAGDTNGSVYGGQSASLSPAEHEPRGGGGPVKLYPAPVRGGGGYDRGGDVYAGQMMVGRGDMGGRDRGLDRGYGQPQGGMQQRPQYGMQQRLPSIDMGIGAIINRPPGSM
jgi:hypothetical protein